MYPVSITFLFTIPGHARVTRGSHCDNDIDMTFKTSRINTVARVPGRETWVKPSVLLGSVQNQISRPKFKFQSVVSLEKPQCLLSFVPLHLNYVEARFLGVVIRRHLIGSSIKYRKFWEELKRHFLFQMLQFIREEYGS
jgi:hypothetical protein